MSFLSPPLFHDSLLLGLPQVKCEIKGLFSPAVNMEEPGF